MANRRQSIKKIRVDKRRREHNVRSLSELKTVLRKTHRLILEKSNDLTEQSRALFSKLDKAVKKNLIHKNRASRMKSRIQQKINTLKAVVKPTK